MGKKKLWIVLPGLALCCSVAVAAAVSPSTPALTPAPAAARTSAAAPRAGSVDLGPAEGSRVAAADPRGAAARLGLRVAPVSPELRAQLGAIATAGLVVLGVDPETPGAAAGLAPYDVLVTVDGRPVQEWLEAEPDGASGTLELRVIRAGAQETLQLGLLREDAAAGAFLSVQDLGADHPFRRAQTWEQLRADYEQEEERFETLAEGAEELRRLAREEARAAADGLRQQAAEQVRTAFDEAQGALLDRVDAALSQELLAGHEALALEVTALVPEAQRLAAEAWFTRSDTLFSELLDGHLEFGPDGEDGEYESVERARRPFQRLAEEADGLLHERAKHVWEEAVERLVQHDERAGAGFLERSAWCAERLEGVRVNLHERITCAFDRAAEELDQQLARRLQRFELPAPGELEMAVREIERQVEAMAEGFLGRTTDALQRYEDELTRHNAAFVEGVRSSADALEVDCEAITDDAETVTLVRLGDAPLSRALDWRARTRRTEVQGTLRAGWRDVVLRARDAVRASAGAVPGLVHEHRIASDHAWQDVRDLLGSTYSRSKDDCWKLDGPHLDGRFPGETDLRGQVALARQ